MSEPKPILQYERPVPGSQHPALMETPEGFALVLARPPQWKRWILPVACMAMAVLLTVACLALHFSSPTNWSGGRLRVVVMLARVEAAIFWAAAAYYVAFLGTRGHLTTSLAVEAGRLVFQKPGLWGLRRREWRVEQVIEARVLVSEPLLFEPECQGEVAIRFDEGRSLRLPFASNDRALVQRLDRLLAHAVASAHPTT